MKNFEAEGLDNLLSEEIEASSVPLDTTQMKLEELRSMFTGSFETAIRQQNTNDVIAERIKIIRNQPHGKRDSLIIPNEKRKSTRALITPEEFEECTKFALAQANYDKQRPNRSGGAERRNIETMFNNSLQGKMAEFAVRRVLLSTHERIDSCSEVDVTVTPRGEYDPGFDLEAITTDGDALRFNVKSVPVYSRLALLEKDDYRTGHYAHSKETCDYLCLVHIDRSGPEIVAEVSFKKWEQVEKLIKNQLESLTFLPKGIHFKLGENSKGAYADASNFYIHQSTFSPFIDVRK
jgi:hypothetical protein